MKPASDRLADCTSLPVCVMVWVLVKLTCFECSDCETLCQEEDTPARRKRGWERNTEVDGPRRSGAPLPREGPA
jgi:hypothetical protein